MALKFVGAGGSDSNDGSTWALRKLTIGALVGILSAGDTGIIGHGVYRESATLPASGSSGNPITLMGDVTGEYTDGVGGDIVWTGSDDDFDGDRANVIAGANRNYWTFRNIVFEAGTDTVIEALGTNCEMHSCRVDGADASARRYGATFGSNALILDSEFVNCDVNGLTVGSNSRVERCAFDSCVRAIETSGNTVKVYNCSFRSCQFGLVHFGGGLTGGQRVEFYSNVFDGATGTAAFCSGADGSTLADGNVIGSGASYSGITPTNEITSHRRCRPRGSMFQELTGRGPLIAGVGAHSAEDDHFGTPDGIGADDVGPVRYAPPAAFGSSGAVFSAPGIRYFDIGVTHNTPFTVSVNTSWSGTITSKPQLRLLGRYGISTQTDTATGSGSTEGLSVGGTATIPGGGNGIMRVAIYAPEVDTSVTFVGLQAA